MPKLERIPANKRDYKKKDLHVGMWFLARGDEILATWPHQPPEEEIVHIIESKRRNIGTKFTLYHHNPHETGHQYMNGYHDVYYYFPVVTWEVQRTYKEQMEYEKRKLEEERRRHRREIEMEVSHRPDYVIWIESPDEKAIDNIYDKAKDLPGVIVSGPVSSTEKAGPGKPLLYPKNLHVSGMEVKADKVDGRKFFDYIDNQNCKYDVI